MRAVPSEVRRDGGQRAAVALVAADHLLGQVLRIGGATAVAEGEHFFPGPERVAKDLPDPLDLRGEFVGDLLRGRGVALDVGFDHVRHGWNCGAIRGELQSQLNSKELTQRTQRAQRRREIAFFTFYSVPSVWLCVLCVRIFSSSRVFPISPGGGKIPPGWFRLLFRSSMSRRC